MDQLDRVQETGDFVEFDKELAELGILLSEAPGFRYFEPSSTAQQDAHLHEYLKFIKSYDKYLRVKDVVTHAVMQDAAFPLGFAKMEKQLIL